MDALGLIAVAVLALPATDRMVDAGGVKLHIRCAGERTAGVPLVVLEAGANQPVKTWDNVFQPIAEFARVCAYDRQGIGSSASAPETQGIVATVDTLHALLEKADERPPYLLTGHSWGGALVRLYASRYPSDVRGLILIDSTHEEQRQRVAALTGTEEDCESIAPVGVDVCGMERELPATWRTDVPLVVLVHSPSTDPPGDPLAALGQELQRDLATRSSQSELIVAQKGVGHFIQNQQPGLVIDAVRQLVQKTRQD